MRKHIKNCCQALLASMLLLAGSGTVRQTAAFRFVNTGTVPLILLVYLHSKVDMQARTAVKLPARSGLTGISFLFLVINWMQWTMKR